MQDRATARLAIVTETDWGCTILSKSTLVLLSSELRRLAP